MWRKSKEEKRDYMNLTWLNRQYYELGRSLQDIADDQGVSMMTINKWVDKIERPGLVKPEEKSINACPHCGQKLHGKARYCVYCGKKVEEAPSIPLVSDKKEDKVLSEFSQIKTEEIQTTPPISEEWKEKIIKVAPKTKTGEIQPTLPIPEEIEKKPKVYPLFCKFCQMKLNKKATFCPQCGTKVKKKVN
ncbi:MAG: hypothetical protein ACW98D_02360 [Promethearchaeota archaeon]|jgi:predicted amidophosphoribosyltransferase